MSLRFNHVNSAARLDLAGLRRDLRDVVALLVMVGIILGALPLSVIEVFRLCLVLALQSLGGVAAVRTCLPEISTSWPLRLAAGLMIGPALASIAAIVWAAVAGGANQFAWLIPVAVFGLLRLRRGEEGGAPRTPLIDARIVALVIACTGLVLSIGYFWLLPASLVCLCFLSMGTPVGGRASGLVVIGAWLIISRTLMQQWAKVNEPIDLLNPSADGLQFEAWGNSVLSFGPFDDTMKSGSQLAYHWLSYGVGGVWSAAASASRFTVSNSALNILASVAAVLAAAGFLQRSSRELSVSWSVIVGAVILCGASLVQPAFALPMDSPSQAFSIGLVLVLVDLVLAQHSRLTLRLLLVVAFLSGLTYLAKTSSGALVVGCAAAVVVSGLMCRWMKPDRANESKWVSRFQVAVAIGIGVVGAHVALIADGSGFSYSSVSLPRTLSAWSTPFSLPYASQGLLAVGSLVLIGLRLGPAAATWKTMKGGAQAVVLACGAAILVGLGVVGNGVQIGTYVLGASAAVAGLVSVRSCAVSLLSITRDRRTQAALVAAVLGGATLAAFGVMRLAGHNLGSRTASLLLGGSAIMVLLLVVATSRVGVRPSSSVLVAVILALNVGVYFGHVFRGEIRQRVEAYHGWTHSADERAAFLSAVEGAQPVANELVERSHLRDIVAVSRPPLDLPLISSLATRRVIAERHIAGYYEAGSKFSKRVDAQDQYGARGAVTDLIRLNDEYCVKWYVAFEPNVLPMYQAPAKVVYADKVATLIEFPDPPGGAECVPSDIKPRD